ncbi:hypothetical protein CTheo_7118 [Ceratobasidium theobromae]|uniref:Transcription initiation factor IIA large subunit n=1 Tax=Ceratobasidium theobromae TaxID=1582974 RepID=A0A5N5QCV8_9AGAM|nr:hypothetical protein CTheo_7118 [Ceratobasidium theobromae]
MSNRIVPQVYRAIIDEVMANIKSEFEEFGVDDEVLAQLQNKWETKVVASNVAQFEPPAQTSPPSRHPAIHPTHAHAPPPPQHHHMHPHHPPHPSHPSLMQYPYQPYPPPPGYPYPYPPQGYQLPPLVAPPPPQPAPSPRVKTEDDDVPKHGTFAPTNVQLARVPQMDGESSTDTMGRDGWDAAVAKRKSPLEAYMKSLQAGPSRLVQLDGSSDLDAGSPPLQTLDDGRGTEEIGSDLDDSDDSDADDVESRSIPCYLTFFSSFSDEGAGEAGDYVFCTYDKVQRVKNKWKCVLKDGMIHVNGKDYLFMKCNGCV